MSTRSGKRIHSLVENIHEPDTIQVELKSERKTISKRRKNTTDDSNANAVLNATAHYVHYPGDESLKDNLEKFSRKLRRHTLKEHNICVTNIENNHDNIDTETARHTRKTKRFLQENQSSTAENSQSDEKIVMECPKKIKNKKKAKKQNIIVEPIEIMKEAIKENVPKNKKKSKKKKHIKKSGSLKAEDVNQENIINSSLNKSNASIDSFHSAAGSPESVKSNGILCKLAEDTSDKDNSDDLQKPSKKSVTPKVLKRKNSTLLKEYGDDCISINYIVDEGSTIKRRSSRSRKSIDQSIDEIQPSETKALKRIDSNLVKESDDDSRLINDIVKDGSTRKRKPSRTRNSMGQSIDIIQPSETKALKRKDSTLVKESDDDCRSINDKVDVSNTTKRKTGRGRKCIDQSIDIIQPSETKILKRKDSILVKESDDACRLINDLFEDGSTRKRKTSRTRKSLDQSINIIQPIDIDNPAEKVQANKSNCSFDSSNTLNVTFEKSNQQNIDDNIEKKLNDTFDKSSPIINQIVEKSDQKINESFGMSSLNDYNIQYETNDEVSQIRKGKRKSLNTVVIDNSVTKNCLNSTFEKSPKNSKLDKTKSLDSTCDKGSCESLTINNIVQIRNEKSDSLNTTFDKSINNSHISINSDDSKTENIINTTPELVESSIEESSIHISPKPLTPLASTEKVKEIPITPLKREGTYTKDSPKVQTPKIPEPATPKSKGTRLSMNETPNRRKSLPSPGCTPFSSSRTSGNKKNTLNVTHSIEKSVSRASLAEPMPRTTKVMFCSPINNSAIVSQIKRKVIKSNLKGSNKSFVFDESMSETNRSVNRKRSYTQSEADTAQRKRSRIGEEMQQSIDRLSRPRTVSASAKLSEPSPSKNKTPTKVRPEPKVSRTKLPNFAALHQKRFEKMESLDECQERKAKRARQLLTPTGSVNLLERVSPKEKDVGSPNTSHVKEPKKHTLESLNPGYTRFGFRMNCEENPFSTSENKTEVKKAKPNGLTRQATLPSLAGTTSLRREVAKQTVMREKSFTGRRDNKRVENRTIIKGVRTNRRFELQMKMRNINA